MRTWREAVRLYRRRGREREAVVQALKAGLAAVLALLLARLLARPLGTDSLFLAPYVAALGVTTTVQRSWAGAARQAVMVLLGLVLAFAAARLVPDEIGAVALVVVVGLLLGRWHRFRADSDWIAITALLLVVRGGGAHLHDLAAWMVLSLVGSTVGAAVNTLVLPPLHLRDGHEALRELTGELGGLLREVAAGVTEGFGVGEADRWLERARDLRRAVRRADDAVWFGRESARWNPRRRAVRRAAELPAGPSEVKRVARLAERSVQVCVLLGDLAETGECPPDPELAGLLHRLGEAVAVAAARTERPGELLDGPMQDVRRLRADGGTEAAQVRATSLVTISDALADLRRGR